MANVELLHGLDPATGQILAPGYPVHDEADVAAICEEAARAFAEFSATDLETRATFLETIAAEIEALGDALIELAGRESGLPAARLTGERGRTCGQLRLFASELRLGEWLGIRIDPALPQRTPAPRPDLRMMRMPLGPVAIFGASNFPLAFSVAGGDTASALAAGCPVIVKGHPAHPGTSAMVADAMRRAVMACGLPDGTFAMLVGASNALGGALVADPRIKAVGFTGSRSGGLALMKIAAVRPEPIPVYAEMSAVNPVVVLPGALAERAESIGAGYAASMTMGAGQFCTNPGIVFAIDGPDLARFVDAARAAVEKSPAQIMLTPTIHASYTEGVARLEQTPGVEPIARGLAGAGQHHGRAVLFSTSWDVLVANPEVTHEVFGAASVLVRCRDVVALQGAMASMEGQLTATVHFAESDHATVATLLPLLADKAGRVIANGWPTGVEVAHAMVHGGPYPATSDGRSTSVGTLAIERFLRPVSFQDFPSALLPPVLRDGGQAGLPHRKDGALVLG